jgi:Tol biopolymer transport system component
MLIQRRAGEHGLDDHQATANAAPVPARQEDRLDSWKKIASYLKRDVRTVQRWEQREAMPVHRHLHDKIGSVYGFRSEIDAWWESRRTRLTPNDTGESDRPTQIVPTATDDPQAEAPRFPLSVLRGALAAGVALIAGALVWIGLERDYFWLSPLANARFTRLADLAGTEQAATLSRDGKFVAFLANREGQVDAWVSELGSDTYRNLTRGAVRELVNPSVRTLGFSADSSLISIWTRRGDGSQSSDVNILAAPTRGGPLQSYLPGIAEFDWSRDGKWLVYHTTAPGDPLFVREAGSREPGADRRIYEAPPGVHCHFPIWSPDEAFIYFVRGIPPHDWDVWRIRPSGQGLERITTHNARVTYPVMLDRRTLLYLATDAEGAGPWMYAVDVNRRIPHRISFGLESYTSLGASADGARVVTTIANPRTSLWHIALGDQHNSGTPTPSPSLVLANGFMPRIGPGFVLFVSSGGEKQSIWTLTRGVKREVWSSAHARIVGAPAIAPDGQRIAFTVENDGKTRLYTTDNDGSNARIVADSLVLQGSPAWAPDGESIVSAVVQAGEPRLTQIFLDGKPPLPLVPEYSLDPVWSPDGRFLVYSGADVGTTFPLRAAAADGRAYPIPALMLTRGARRVAFFGNQHTLMILRGEIGHKNLWLVDLETGAERELAELPQGFDIHDFDVSADGGEIVFERAQENSDVALIERRQ